MSPIVCYLDYISKFDGYLKRNRAEFDKETNLFKVLRTSG